MQRRHPDVGAQRAGLPPGATPVPILIRVQRLVRFWKPVAVDDLGALVAVSAMGLVANLVSALMAACGVEVARGISDVFTQCLPDTGVVACPASCTRMVSCSSRQHGASVPAGPMQTVIVHAGS